MSRKSIAVALALVLVAAFLVYNSDAMKEARFIKTLVARNIEARGGAEAWENVSSLRLSGQMDLGQEMVVPYVLEQKRPDKMCLEFVFDGETAVQCADGKTGWKLLPYLGRTAAESMTEAEYREAADSAEPYGLLYNYAQANNGRFPTGESSPEASLSLLHRFDPGADAELLRGKTVPVDVVQEILESTEVPSNIFSYQDKKSGEELKAWNQWTGSENKT